jgi:GxxExxY protein
MRTTETQRRGGSDDRDINEITGAIIGAAIAVHRVLGPGLLESIYESALCVEFEERQIRYARQQQVPAFYKGRRVGVDVVDLIVEDQVVVEIKSVLINFNSAVLEDGIIRRAL